MWHIMKVFASHGIADFVICTGYKGDIIKDYFLNYEARNNDFTVTLGRTHELTFHDRHLESEWRVTVADTGLDTMTGGRVRRIRRYVGEESFMVTYGDGIADVNVTALLDFHRREGKIATLTTVRPTSRFGVLELDENTARVDHFREKPTADGWINAGFFVFQSRVFAYLEGDDTVLEETPLQALAKDGELVAYRHEGFFQPMDTYREAKLLNDLWHSRPPWKVWSE